jgi:hypothetical protein
MKTKLLKKLRMSSKKYVQIVQVYDLNIKKYIIWRKENILDDKCSLLHVTKDKPTEFIEYDFSTLNGDELHYRINFGGITAYTNFNDAIKKLKDCRRAWILEEIQKMRNKSPIIKVFDV